ncbi:MAG: TolC family protein [Myxococcaceae bacterium]|nr:MAG: TolC family protein [Myxococcaceae bacterium]
MTLEEEETVKRFVRHAVPALLAAVIAVATPSVAAQGVALRVGYAEVLSLARRRSPEAVAAERRVEVTRSGVAAARPWLQENPSVGFVAGPRFRTTDRVTDVYVTLGVPLEVYGVRGLRLGAAEGAVARDQALRDDAARRATAAALDAYHGALHAAALRDAAEAQRTLAADIVRVAEARRSAGEAGDLDLLAARVELARAGRAVAEADAGVAAADAALRFALGLDADQALSLAGALDEVRSRYAAADVPAAAGVRPDLHAAELSLAVTQEEVALEERRRLPVPTLQLSYQREEGADVYLAGLALPLPFFQRNQGPVAEAHARLGLLAAERHFLRRRAATEVVAARARLDAAHEGLRLLEADALPNLGATVRLVQRAYELGQADLTRVLVVRQQAAETRREHLDALLEVALAGTAFDAARGVFR